MSVSKRDHPDVRSIKSLSDNLKMDFDLAKDNFREAGEAIQAFQCFQQNTEEVIARLKERVYILRMKLTRNPGCQTKDIKVLEEHLRKADNLLEKLSLEIEKLEEGCRFNKRLKMQLNSEVVIPKGERFSDRKRKLATLEMAIASTELAISNATMEKGALVERCSRMEELLYDTKGQLQNQKTNSSEQADVLSDWCPDILTKLSHLFEIPSHTVDGNVLTIEFLNPPQSPLGAPSLVMTITYEHYKNHYSIIDANVNHDSLDVTMVIDYAIHKNDLSFLLLEVQNSWKKHFPLLLEIVSLREKYPMDWQPYQGKLCVLLGQRVNINCMMNIPKDYPIKGSISVERIEGLTADINIAEIKPNESDISLTAWVELLATTFHKL